MKIEYKNLFFKKKIRQCSSMANSKNNNVKINNKMKKQQ